MNQIFVNQEEERLLFAMQLLGDETRYRMFKVLISNVGLCVGDIAKELNISASAVSQHFRQFEILGIVDRVRSGQRICYELKQADPIVADLQKIINKRQSIRRNTK